MSRNSWPSLLLSNIGNTTGISSQPTEVLADHKNLQYFTTTRNLSRCQVRWSEILSDYHLQSSTAQVPRTLLHALSQHDRPEGGSTASEENRHDTATSNRIFNQPASSAPVPESASIQTTIHDHVETDNFLALSSSYL